MSNYPKKNKLDPFRARLMEWVAEGKSQREMLGRLKEDGCSCSPSSLSNYLSLRRREDMEAAMLGNVASGREMLRKLDVAYRDNPEPAIAELIRVSKTLILSLQVEGTANPDLLRLSNSMQQTVLNYLSGERKVELEGRKLDLALDKFQFEAAKACLAVLPALKVISQDNGLSDGDKIDAIRLKLFGVVA